jgi:hypothetical protein
MTRAASRAQNKKADRQEECQKSSEKALEKERRDRVQTPKSGKRGAREKTDEKRTIDA